MDIDQWILDGEIGTSSRTLWVAMKGITMDKRNQGDVPFDPDDFERCYKLMQIATDEEKEMAFKNVVEISPVWIPFVREWKKLTELYEEESPNRTCPKLYDLLEDLRMEGYAIKKARRKEQEGE